MSEHNNWREGYPCQTHETRIGALEEVIKELGATVKRLELMAASATGSLKTILVLQPIVTGVIVGVVVFFLTRR